MDKSILFYLDGYRIKTWAKIKNCEEVHFQFLVSFRYSVTIMPRLLHILQLWTFIILHTLCSRYTGLAGMTVPKNNFNFLPNWNVDERLFPIWAAENAFWLIQCLLSPHSIPSIKMGSRNQLRIFKEYKWLVYWICCCKFDSIKKYYLWIVDYYTCTILCVGWFCFFYYWRWYRLSANQLGLKKRVCGCS